MIEILRIFESNPLYWLAAASLCALVYIQYFKEFKSDERKLFFQLFFTLLFIFFAWYEFIKEDPPEYKPAVIEKVIPKKKIHPAPTEKQKQFLKRALERKKERQEKS